MRLLQRNYDVETRYGGGFVQEIDGVAGGRESGRPADWFYYVNGIEAPVGAAERRVAAGERVWWDHHAWEAAQRVPAVVGSFPEPFLTGLEGKRFPVKLVCAGDAERTVRRGGEAAAGRRRRRGLALGDPAVAGRGGPARAGRPLGRRARGRRRPPARARAGGDRRLRAAEAAPATGSCCSTPTASPCARCARAAAWWPQRASRRRRRPGSSPAPTRSASPRRRRR